MSSNIHATAIVDPKAELGADVSIGPYAIIEAGAKIGAGCKILAHAVISTGAELGAKCEIHMGAVVGHTPQDFSYKGQPTKAVLGDNVVIREYVTVHRSTNVDAPTRLGNGCYLMVNSHVAHDCQLGDGVILANSALLAGHVHIGDRALISGNVVIHQFVRVGKLAMLSGGSRFGQDIPPYVIADGTNTISALNVIGLRRAPDFKPEDRDQLKQAFKILYRQNVEWSAALERLKKEFSSPAVKYWVEFLSTPTKRGYCRYKPSRVRDEISSDE